MMDQANSAAAIAIPPYVYEKLVKILPALIRERKSVCLYPAGALSAALLGSGLLKDVAINGLADRNAERFPDGFAGFPVRSPDDLTRATADIILVCSMSYHLEMLVQLTPVCITHEIELVDLCESAPTAHSAEARLAELLGNMHRVEKMHTLMCQQEIRSLLAEDRFRNPRRLEPFGYKCYSQHDEDGMLAEIIRRIGDGMPRTFVEFGVGDGRENNTLLLLKQGWKGLWIEGSPESARAIRRDFAPSIADGDLAFIEAFIDRDNINALIGEAFTGEIGFLGVDIDGNDLYVWDAISVVSPLVVVMEYNAKFPPPMKWSIEYDPRHQWRFDDYMGASLAAVFELGRKKGYQLVGCNLNGTNAFFVRQDVLGSTFLISDDAADYYHPPRYFLTDGYKWMAGHPANTKKGRSWK